jgi:hypothetical protein
LARSNLRTGKEHRCPNLRRNPMPYLALLLVLAVGLGTGYAIAASKTRTIALRGQEDRDPPPQNPPAMQARRDTYDLEPRTSAGRTRTVRHRRAGTSGSSLGAATGERQHVGQPTR